MERELEAAGSELRCRDVRLDLRKFREVKVVSVGKAAHNMTNGLAAVLPSGIPIRGIVSAPTKPREAVPGITYFTGGHPVPNQQSWNAAKAILTLLESCDESTLVIFLLSGGGSALMELPLDPAQTLQDVQAFHRALVGCGASIDEINAVRKHFSAVKGGRLAMAAGAATKLTLAISDVPAGKESALASGPTLPDPTTLAGVSSILQSQERALRARLRLLI